MEKLARGYRRCVSEVVVGVDEEPRFGLPPHIAMQYRPVLVERREPCGHVFRSPAWLARRRALLGVTGEHTGVSSLD